MSLVNVTSVVVGKNPTSVLDGFLFDVVFECLERLENDLEWKLIYVGSSDDKSLDQELDCVVMGPINRGALKFTFEADGPDFSKISPEDIHGFTIILLTGSYRDEEFIRIGWYIHNMYLDPVLQEDPPDVPQLDKMQRIILTEAPRVTRFKVGWDLPKVPSPPSYLSSPPAAIGDGDEAQQSSEPQMSTAATSDLHLQQLQCFNPPPSSDGSAAAHHSALGPHSMVPSVAGWGGAGFGTGGAGLGVSGQAPGGVGYMGFAAQPHGIPVDAAGGGFGFAEIGQQQSDLQNVPPGVVNGLNQQQQHQGMYGAPAEGGGVQCGRMFFDSNSKGLLGNGAAVAGELSGGMLGGNEAVAVGAASCEDVEMR